MQRLLTLGLVFVLGLSLSLDADARRFGGGRSWGSAPSHQMRQAPAPTRATPSQNATPPVAGRPAGGMSRWLGPLAGFAAGGLLASMFMGGGFHGFQMFDFLIIGGLAFIAYRVFAARRRAQTEPAMSNVSPFTRELPGRELPNTGSIIGSALNQSSMPPPPPAVINAPAWFNETNFINNGREHFLTLQKHWDANEMTKVAEFTTPQLFGFLQKERAELGDAYQSTYIDNLEVQLDGVDDLADKTVATLSFTGTEKSSRFDAGEPFSESWRLERTQGQNQPWLIAGIRQN